MISTEQLENINPIIIFFCLDNSFWGDKKGNIIKSSKGAPAMQAMLLNAPVWEGSHRYPKTYGLSFWGCMTQLEADSAISKPIIVL